MTALPLYLRPAALTHLETLRGCEDAMRSVAPVEAAAIRLLDGQRREDVSLVAGWFAIAARLAPGREASFEERRAWETLRREAVDAFTGDATTPLGRALAAVATSWRLAPEPFQEFLDARDDEREISVRQTREEVAEHAGRRVTPVGRALLPLLGADTERAHVLADAALTACQLAEWWESVGRNWRMDGRLVLPMEDVLAHGVDLAAIDRGEVRLPFAHLMADEIVWARQWFARGWPLVKELGVWRGRLATYALRRRLQRLDAIARRRFDVLTGAPRRSRVRAALAIASSALTRRRPRTLPEFAKPPERPC